MSEQHRRGGAAGRQATRPRPTPREARYQSLRRALEGAQRELDERLRNADTDAGRSGALGDFLEEMIRVTRADSRFLDHPIVNHWFRQAQAWGWLGLLRKLPGGQDRKVLRPLTPKQLELLDAVDRLRWGPELTPSLFSDPSYQRTFVGTASGERQPIRSMSSIYEILMRNPRTRHLLARPDGRAVSYQAFHQLVADGHGKGGTFGRLRWKGRGYVADRRKRRRRLEGRRGWI